MTSFDHEFFGVRVSGVAGLRYEHLDNKISALDCKLCSNIIAGNITDPNQQHSIVERKYAHSSGYFLLSFIIAADLTRTLKLRGAYYKTYVRPQPRDNVPVTSLNLDTSGTDPIYVVAIGATDLKPYTADSFDVSLEWYNRPGGVFAIAAYQKNIKGYIGQIKDPNILCPADGLINGLDYGLGKLTIDGTNCFSTNKFVVAAGGPPRPAIARISGVINQLPMTVRGIEVSVQQNFDFLPGFLKGFGDAANYTYTTIKGHDSSGNPITLPSVAKNNVNVIGYYENKLFGIRLTYNWRGDYDLAAGNSFVGDARSVKARSQLDASASINITKWLALSVDAFNLTDATRAEYEADPRLPRRLDYDGRTYQATLRATF
jgi:TonB-dependent receptor